MEQNPLYRAFERHRYAREFVKTGQFRMRRLDLYRDMEDRKRADASEGIGHYVDKDDIHESFELGNPIYVLCCSAWDVNLIFLGKKMGPYIVKIRDPASLAADIGDYLRQQNIRFFGEVMCQPVEYTKGTRIETELDEMKRAELSVVQKDSSFSDEKEHRFYVVLNADRSTREAPEHMDITLQRAPRYVEFARSATARLLLKTVAQLPNAWLLRMCRAKR